MVKEGATVVGKQKVQNEAFKQNREGGAREGKKQTSVPKGIRWVGVRLNSPHWKGYQDQKKNPRTSGIWGNESL